MDTTNQTDLEALSTKSKYNNWLIAKLINIFDDMEERRKEREYSLALMQAPT